MCASCYDNEKDQHSHKMDLIQSTYDSKPSSESSINNNNESVKRCITSLVHSCQCRDANCRRITCQKMKRVVQHTKICKKRHQANCCPVCKQLIALCCYHAKHCNLNTCPV